jgi:hypothetical protein
VLRPLRPVLLLALIGLAAHRAQEDEPLLAPPAPAIAMRPERVELERNACAECHAEVAEEWATSAHALAWVDEVYQADIATKRRPDLCHGCHVPEPLLAGPLARPLAREGAREHGVSCESCHADADGAVLGLRGTEVAAHPGRASEHLAVPGSNALCSACHATTIGPVIGIAKDFAAAGLEARGLSCVGCHMAPVERAFAAGAPVRAGRSHALQTPRDPAFLRLAFGLEAQRSGGRSALVVRNQAGHRVPGLIGREITFRAELRDASGTVLERAELVVDERAYLPVDAVRELRFTRSGASIHVLGLHRDPRAEEPVTFADETLTLR